jgi:hypothetical protein
MMHSNLRILSPILNQRQFRIRHIRYQRRIGKLCIRGNHRSRGNHRIRGSHRIRGRHRIHGSHRIRAGLAARR